jgi:ribonuclease HI
VALMFIIYINDLKKIFKKVKSHLTHPLVYECKQMCNNLLEDGVKVEIMWIPSHVDLEGNKIVDERARHAALSGAVFDRALPLIDFQVWQDLFC